MSHQMSPATIDLNARTRRANLQAFYNSAVHARAFSHKATCRVLSDKFHLPPADCDRLAVFIRADRDTINHRPAKPQVDILTTKLRNGTTVLAKQTPYGVSAYTYANQTQAERKRDSLTSAGVNCYIYHPGGVVPFFIAIAEPQATA